MIRIIKVLRVIRVLKVIRVIRVIRVINAVVSKRAGREGGPLLSPFLPATDTQFLHKENKICRFCDYVFPITTLRWPGCGCLRLPRCSLKCQASGGERGSRAGLCLSLPALPHISSWLLKMRGNASNEGRKSVNYWNVAVLRRILLRMCG